MFIRDDAYDILFEESEKYDLDILNFNYIYSNNSFDVQKVITFIHISQFIYFKIIIL